MRRWLSAIVVLALMVGGVPADEVAKKDKLEKLMFLLKSLFPDPPRGTERRLEVESPLGELAFDLNWKLFDQVGETDRQEVASGFMGLDQNGVPHELTVYGRLANEESLRKMRSERVVNGHNLTSAAAEKITGRKVAYGPDRKTAIAALVNDLQPMIERFLGKSLGDTEITFSFERPGRQPGEKLADFVWEVSYRSAVVWKNPNWRPPVVPREAVTCLIQVEPFEGRVILINNY